MDPRQQEMCRQVTVAAIMRNEEARIAEFMDNLPLGVSAIIYDDGSTDRTAEIARAKGATVIDGRVEGVGFAAKRNKVLSHVETEWALHLDADECCPDATLLRAIDAVLADPAIDAISFPIHGYFLKRRMRGRAWHLRGVRFARASRSRWENAVHEKLVCDAGSYPLDAPLLHFGDEDYLRRAKKSIEYNIMEVGRLKRKITFSVLLLQPFWEFFKYYFIHFGWVDGKAGVIFAFHIWAAWFQRLAIAYTSPGQQNRP